MSEDESPTARPAARLYFEDLAVDDEFDFGSCTVTSEEIRTFAERYDPQWFHVDETAAEESFFDGLVASGWHTVVVANRMMIDDVFDEVAVMGGSGVEDLRWPTPVRPGDTLSGCVTVTGLETGSRDDRGYVTLDTVVTTHGGRTVLTMTSHLLVRQRPPREDE